MGCHYSTPAWRGAGRLRVTVLVTGAALLLLGFSAPVRAAREADGAESRRDEHCITRVVAQRPTGENVVSDPDCYPSFSQAMFVASRGAWRLPADAPVTMLESPWAGKHAPGHEAPGGSSLLAVHYSDDDGRGSSIAVYGSSCSGYWNTWPNWVDRISSTYNGCYETRHHDRPNLGGVSAAYRGHHLWNVVGYMNDRSESISYSSW